MIESTRCPGCLAHYGLRRERVHAGIRRARCFRCGETFGVAAEVARLLELLDEPGAPLAPAPILPTVAEPVSHLTEAAAFILPEDEATLVATPLEPEPEPIPEQSVLPSEHPDVTPGSLMELDADLLALPHEPEPELDVPVLEVAPPAHEDESEFLAIDDFLEEVPTDAGVAAPPAVPEPLTAEQDEPSLTLGDLEGAEEEILEKTLVVEPEPEPVPGQGFSSAKDAISKILGGLDTGTPKESPLTRRTQSSVDMEATLNALEHTLGGTPVQALKGTPEPPAAPAAAAPTSPAVPELPDVPSPLGGTATTMRLSMEEIRKAMATPVEPTPTPAQSPMLPAPPENQLDRFGTMPRATLTPPPPPSTAPEQDPNLLKVRVGGETYTNVTIDQLTNWVEQGRVLEYHEVARQFSDHWIEASKVPALRPVFERVKRMRAETGAPQGISDGTGAQKKTLFGGLFGRN